MGWCEVRMIGLGLLRGHPENANRMAPSVKRKLKGAIGRTGRYEPLVVRVHPREAGAYELINGHHRAEVLRELGHKEAACVVWEVDDRETRILLATINRLSGRDVPGKRMALLEALAAEVGGEMEALSRLVPEGAATLEKVLAKAAGEIAEAVAVAEMPEALTVFMSSGEKKEVVKKLRETDGDMGRALVRWMRERP